MKISAYDKATAKLMQQAAEYDVPANGIFTFPDMVFLLRNAFKQKITYRKVFNEMPPRMYNTHIDPATGFCLVSSYYIYENTGGEEFWTLKQTPLHWWLESKIYNDNRYVFDLTYTQFDTPFPYEMGVPEVRINPGIDPEFLRQLQIKSAILGKSAGMI